MMSKENMYKTLLSVLMAAGIILPLVLLVCHIPILIHNIYISLLLWPAVVLTIIYLCKDYCICRSTNRAPQIVGYTIYFIGLLISTGVITYTYCLFNPVNLLFDLLYTHGISNILIYSIKLYDPNNIVIYLIVYSIGPVVSLIGMITAFLGREIWELLYTKIPFILLIFGLPMTVISKIGDYGGFGEIIFIAGLCMNILSVILYFNSNINNSIQKLGRYLDIGILPTHIMSKHLATYSHEMLEEVKLRFKDMENGKLILYDTKALEFQKNLILSATHEILAIHLVNSNDPNLSDLKRWIDPKKDFSVIVDAYGTLNELRKTGERNMSKCLRMTVIKDHDCFNYETSQIKDENDYKRGNEDLFTSYLATQKEIGFESILVTHNRINSVISSMWPENEDGIRNIEDILIVDREIVFVAVPDPQLRSGKTKSVVYENKEKVAEYLDVFNFLENYIKRNNCSCCSKVLDKNGQIEEMRCNEFKKSEEFCSKNKNE